MKTCTKCQRTLELTAFYFEKRSGSHLLRCKDCVKAYIRANSKLPHRQQARKAAYHKKRATGWRSTLPYSQRSEEDKARAMAAVKRYRKAHPEQIPRMNLYRRLQRSAQLKAAWPVIVNHYGGLCLCCQSAAAKVCCDHVERLTVEDAQTVNQIANLQPLCASCNTVKRSFSYDYRPDKGAWIAELVRLNPALWIDHSIKRGGRIKPIALPLIMPGQQSAAS